MSSSARSPATAEVILFVPNAHCPSCTTHILDLLAGLPLPLIQPSVSFLTKRLAFSLPAEGVDIASATRLVESTLADGGFEVVRPSAVVVGEEGSVTGPHFLPISPNPATSGARGNLLSRSVLGRVFGARQARRRAELGRRLADDRRRQHLAHCLDCQRANTDDDCATSAGKAADVAETFELAVSRPRVADLVETTLSIDGMFCAACTKTLTDILVAHPAITTAEVVLLSNAAVVTHDAAGVSTSDLVELVEDAGYGAEIVGSRPVDRPSASARSSAPDGSIGLPSMLRSTWEVRGMTCASCSGPIIKALSKLPDVLSSSVSALQGSAVIDHLVSLAPEAVTEAIEDAGFDAELVDSTVVNAASGPSIVYPAAGLSNEALTAGSTVGSRELRVRIEGMFCGACVRKVDVYLAHLAQAGQIRSATAVTLQSPLTTVVYDPTPSFTVRELLAGLAALDPVFSAEPYAPPSLSARARAIQAREARQLLGNFALTFVAAVPTFIVAIVGMVLLPGDAPFRLFWDQPVWGGASLGTIVLWILATIVQFGVGRIFYKRAFRPIAAHFRRRQSSAARATCWSWRSLFSFGSMDLLVVLSTTTAYFASLAMLAVDVRSPRMAKDEEKTMTLFDASVFLIFFIVAGRALEGWAKSKTGDAIALLGTLRPDTALLVAPTLELDHGNSPDAVSRLVLEPTVSTSSAGTLFVKESGHPSTVELSGLPAEQSAGTSTSEVAVSHLELGDIVLVRPGALPPSDGTIVRGHAAFDESSLTGESRPVAKHIGDVVLTGTVNVGREAVVVRVDSLGEDTMLSRIGKAVEGAMSGKSRIEELAERITGVFVPCIVYFALIVLVVWLSLTLSGRIPDDWIKARAVPTTGDRVFWAFEFCIAVLVVACPCGIGLAAPTATAVGLGLAAQAGVLAQGGGSAFQAATKIDTVVFDKTGTLTTGKPIVTDHDYLPRSAARGLCDTLDSEAADDRRFLLSVLRELESQSSHPLASALQNFADEQLALLPASSLPEVLVTIGASEEIVGRGLKAVVTSFASSVGQQPLRFEVCIGNEALMTAIGAALPTGSSIQSWKEGAKSVVLLAVKRLTPLTRESRASTFEVCATFAVSDPLRSEAEGTITKLRKAGKEVWLCSGDNAVTARAVARQVGIPDDFVVAGVLPEGKAEHINKLKSMPALTQSSGVGRCVMMVADGVNDAVALAAADIGVAMGSGSQVSVVSADFVLLNSSLDSLHRLFDISRRVLNRTKLNFCWAIVFNLVCLPLAGGVFMAAGRTKLAPVWSALAMALSSVSVVMSSLALKWGI